MAPPHIHRSNTHKNRDREMKKRMKTKKKIVCLLRVTQKDILYVVTIHKKIKLTGLRIIVIY